MSRSAGDVLGIVQVTGESELANEGETRVRWQKSLKEAIRDPQELLRELGLSLADVPYSKQGSEQFPIFVTREFVGRMAKRDALDPLFLQVWPLHSESKVEPGDLRDAIGEMESEAIPGMLHKYHGRVLLIASGACAIHCRYCFRRHFPYENAPKSIAQWEPAIRFIEQDTSITEVILSGGDPLSLVDSSLKALVERIESISHITRLRIHSRLPVVLPSRVTSELEEMITNTRLAVWFVLHINHGNEIDGDLAEAIGRLRRSGATMLNQAVLLKGVNDQVETLEALFSRLVDLQVMPYYLHQLDRVEGASHWEVNRERGRELIKTLRTRLPGYAIPNYVKEESGEPNKTPL